METLAYDLRHAARSLLRAPGFSAVVLLLLVLGSGLNTALFSVLDAALIRPLPYADPDRLVFVSETHAQRGSGAALRPANFLDFRAANDVFEGAAAVKDADAELTGDGEPERIKAHKVLDEFFPLLGVPPLVGRTFSTSDYAAGRSDVTVLSFGFWQRRLGADPACLGRSLRLDGRAFTVVGVMPREFQGLGGGQELWLPWLLTPDERENRQTHEFFGLARLRRGVSLAQASARMSQLYRELEERFPADNRGWGVQLVPWRDVLLGRAPRALSILMAAAALILAIAWINVAGLLLARAVDREREIAVRLALGASRGQIFRQLLGEGLLLGGLGAGLSLLVALAALRLSSGLPLPTAVPFAFEPRLDTRVFAVTTGVSLLGALLFSLLPALQSARLEPRLGKGDGRLLGRERRQRTRRLLVLGQVALGFVSLAAAGLTLKSFVKLHQVELGFEPKGVLALELDLPETRYPTDDAVRRFVGRAVDETGAIPGVVAAASASHLPLTRVSINLRFAIEGRAPDGPDRFSAAALSVSPGFFATIASRVVRGRALTASGAGEVVIDETLARQYWPGEDPLGRRIRFLYPELAERWFEVVGVLRPIRYESPMARPERTLYMSQTDRPRRQLFLLLRTESEPLGLAGAAKAHIRAIDRHLPIGEVRTLEQVAAAPLGEPRLRALLLGLFAALAVVLASAGLYGLLAHSVARRTREIGVRMALGAGRGDVVKLVMSEGALLAGIGIGVGLSLTLALARFLQGSLHGVDAGDPTTHALVSALLAGVAWLASYLPARRAAGVEPAAALRRE